MFSVSRKRVAVLSASVAVFAIALTGASGQAVQGQLLDVGQLCKIFTWAPACRPAETPESPAIHFAPSADEVFPWMQSTEPVNVVFPAATTSTTTAGQPQSAMSASAQTTVDIPHGCTIDQCGPPLGMPNTLCPDGKTVAGPGKCLFNPSTGNCGWEVTTCAPMTSSAGSSASHFESSTISPPVSYCCNSQNHQCTSTMDMYCPGNETRFATAGACQEGCALPHCENSTCGDGACSANETTMDNATAGKIVCSQDCTVHIDPPVTCGEHLVGEGWKDGCNSCVCNEGGQVICTEAVCPTQNCGNHNIGETWSENCNSCTCTESGIACTQAACPPSRCGNDICEEGEANSVYGGFVDDPAVLRSGTCPHDCDSTESTCGNGIFESETSLYSTGRGTGPYDNMTYYIYESEITFVPAADMQVERIAPDVNYCNGECSFSAELISPDGSTLATVHTDISSANAELIPDQLAGNFSVHLQKNKSYRLKLRVTSTMSVGIYTAGATSPSVNPDGTYTLTYARTDYLDLASRGPIGFSFRGGPDEQCDDGNAKNGDGCSSECMLEVTSSPGGCYYTPNGIRVC